MWHDVIERMKAANDRLEDVAREMADLATAMEAIVAESRRVQAGEERAAA